MLPSKPQLPDNPVRDSNQALSRAQRSSEAPSFSNNNHAVSSSSSNFSRNFFYVKAADSVLFSATQTACPSISEVKLDFKHEDPDPEEIFELRFDLRQYIQIASTPDDMELKYSGPLLQRLATINIVGRGMTHALSKEQKTSWHWLENTLYHAASVFSTDALLPMEFRTLPLPSSYGYLRDHKTHGRALRCAKRSRLAFHGLLGLLNLFYGRVLWRYDKANSFARQKPPSPSQMLVESGLSESHVCDIISALQPEILGRCVGVVLDPRRSEWGHIFPYLNHIRAPVWVKVGRYRGAYDPKTFKADNFKTAVPREDEKIKVGSVINKTISEETSSDSSAVNPDSLHRWDAFVESRKQKQLDFQSRASESIKERVRRRLEQASNFILPTRPDGTRFFLWYRSKKGRFRGEIDFEDARIEFETRPRGQLIYDELSNQWDVCSLFDSEPEVTNDDLVDDTNDDLVDDTNDDLVDDTNDDLVDDTNNLTSNEIIPPISHPQLNSPPILPHNHNEIGRTIVYHGCIREDILFASSLEDVLHSRYGLLCCNQSDIQSDPDYTVIPDAQIIDMQTVRKYLMEINLPLIGKKNEFAIRYFISSLVLDINPPSLVWDLHHQNIRELVVSNTYFTFTPVKDNTLDGYLAFPRIEKYARKWNLFVNSALAVVQCIREQWGPSLEDVILCFFERGIQFKVLFNTARPIVDRPRTVFDSNLRPHNWQPDKVEYMDYECRRNRLLKLPHVRVAVAQGGILWRICKQELASDIPSGPSKDVQFFSDMSPDAPCDHLFDTLSKQEIDILCGVYHVLTDRGEQTSIMSWWPTPQLWSSSGLDMGYWTHSAEQMFQSRLKMIRQGEAPLLTSRKWKADLKYYKNQTKKFVGAVEKECVKLVGLL